MSKRFVVFSFVLVLVLVLASFGSAKAGSGITFKEVRNSLEGPTFVFEVDKPLDGSDLNTTLKTAGGVEYPLYCANQEDNGLVVCHTSSKVSDQAVSFYFGGEFWELTVPPEWVSCGGYLVKYYDWNSYYWFDTSYWVEFNRVCADQKPDVGDVFIFYNDYYYENFYYIFREGGPHCPVLTDLGDGFYREYCPYP